MKNKNSELGKTAILCCVAALFICGTSYCYNSFIQDFFSKSIRLDIEGFVSQQKHIVKVHVQSDMVILENIARCLGRNFDPNYNYTKELYAQIVGTNFDNILLCDLNGKAFNQDGRLVDLSEYAHFQHARNGKTYVNSPQASMLRNVFVTPTAAPVFDSNGKVVAVLSAAYVSNNLQHLLCPTFRGEGSTYLIDSNGIPIVTNDENWIDLSEEKTPTLFDKLSQVNFIIGSLQELTDNMAKGNSGYLTYEIDGSTYYMQYAPADINNWYILLAVESKTAFMAYKEIQNTTFVVSAIIAVVCFLFFGYLLLKLLFSQRQLFEVNEKLNSTILDLYTAATTDGLTGIYNRRALEEFVEKKLKDPPADFFQAMFLVDLDNLKAINDTQGHAKGDEALSNISKALQASFRNEDVIGRLGGDEFLVFIPRCASHANAAACAERLIACLFKIDASLTISIGIYLDTKKDMTFDEMYRNADAALYYVKNNGKNNFHIFTDGTNI